MCAAARGLPEVDIGVCPPFVYVADAAAAIGDAPVRLGGQDCARVAHGAFTGEVSANMLADVGCSFVLVGHSERRTLYGESDSEVATKAVLGLAAGLVPVVCVGETLEEREAGRTESVVARQLDAVIGRLDGDALARVIVAYEPVWGHRHGPDGDAGTGERRACVPPGNAWRLATRAWRPRSAFCTAGA